MFESETIVVEIFVNRMVLRSLASGHSLEVAPSTPFSHPRMLLGDFNVAERALKEALHKMRKPRFWTMPPKVVLHPRERLEGGLSPIEHRAITELAIAAGAMKVGLFEGNGTVTAVQAAAALAAPRK